ncbi:MULTISPECIES: molybdopterin-dependent oxidoreductase [Halolamina]|uniref:Oxidoreductase molybdopterin binding domain-containing protein n=1 Tax=Halolamina pelagica TaxID=699431 RepID=A0A1I5RS32_9EURY|nr:MULTISPECIES: molybdopterin-dependent oxidoreductase [Halolamina]NHX35311.1 molybdopterin-dependent oxidoreductase [Halolamina sp. R1-12]SFP61190.1 Oxidoreductase molybdopterin binding domain-containing protein [Halolamina pelagica]
MGRFSRRLRRLAPPPRVVDWAILAVVAGAVATGLLAWTGWLPAALPVDLHGIVGLTLACLLLFKFARVARRVLDRGRWDPSTPISVLLGSLAVAVLASGAFWGLGGNVPLGPWTTLAAHVGLGLLVVPILLLHLRARLRFPSRTDASRRSALRLGGLLVAGTIAWRLSEAVGSLRGATIAETGSKPTGELYDTETEGGSFPVTSWVADDPEPIDRSNWTLTVAGLDDAAVELAYGDLLAAAGEERRARLDCTSGWYTVQDWEGVRVGDLLAEAGVDAGVDGAGEAASEARWVRFVSVTGYRWSLPIEEARDALLATAIDGSRLAHGHGGPARLVAPGRRGFQWVKWVERVELRRDPDPAQWAVTLVSGFD